MAKTEVKILPEKVKKNIARKQSLKGEEQYVLSLGWSFTTTAIRKACMDPSDLLLFAAYHGV